MVFGELELTQWALSLGTDTDEAVAQGYSVWNRDFSSMSSWSQLT